MRNINYFKNIDGYNNIADLPKVNFDLIVVSTIANSRGELMYSISQNLSFYALIVEKPITNSFDDLKYFYNIDNKKNIFVNHHRRYQDLHNHILNLKFNATKIIYQSSNLGLLCNFSHYVDFARMLIGRDKKIRSVECKFTNIFMSKRSNYIEVNGSLVINFSDGIILEIQNCPNLNQDRIIKLLNKNDNYNLNETKGFLIKNNKILQKFEPRLQSELTGKYFQDILENKLKLPTISDCIYDYEVILPEIEKSLIAILKNNKDINMHKSTNFFT